MRSSRLDKVQALTALASVTLAALLGVLGWQLGKDNVGYILAVLIAGQGLVFAGIYIANYRLVTATLPSLLGGRSLILTPGAGMKTFLSSAAPHGGELSIITTQGDMEEAAALAKAASNMCDVCVILPPALASTYESLDGTQSLFSLHEAPFTMAIVDAEKRQRVLVFVAEHGYWLLLPDDAGIPELGLNYLSQLRSYAFNPDGAADPKWLARKIDDARAIRSTTLNALARGQFECITPNAVYSEQLELSRGARSIAALDKTDLREWFYPHGLGGVLERNSRTVATHGSGSVRRIIYVPSREHVSIDKQYRRDLRRVLEMHKGYGVEVGIIYQDDLADKTLILDSVLYDNRVLWVETSPRSRHAGTGYFSTLAADLHTFELVFEGLWSARHCPSPVLEADLFLAASTTNNESGFSG